MSAAVKLPFFDDTLGEEPLFARIAEDLYQQGFSVQPMALPEGLTNELFHHLQQMNEAQFNQAGIGRAQDFMQNDFVRKDEICWINGESEAGQNWLGWTGRFQQFLNRRLFLGLFSFESHFAHYPPGAFYKRHLDAFKGEANRVLSLVVYLNPDWQVSDGGQLVLYRDDQDQQGQRVLPNMGTIVTFLSEEFPHEVLPAAKDRFSIAGWFRVNGSHHDRVDPAN